MDPTVLDTADIDLTFFSFFSMQKGMDANDFIRQICKSVVRLSSVRELYVESNMKLFSYMHSVAVVVPELLLNILDYVNITGLQGNNDEVNLVGYILKNAIGLNHLYMLVYVNDAVEDEDARVGKEFKFYKNWHRLLITSLTTRVVFSGQYVRKTNDTTTSHDEIVLRL
ncbi:F-box/LRR-repeat protein 13 [Bienertia sinuspersici]